MRYYLDGEKYGKSYSIAYGIDHTTGFFITITRGEEIVNYSQFCYFHLPFTENTFEGLKNVIKVDDLKEILEKETPEIWIYFDKMIPSKVIYTTTIGEWLAAFKNREFTKAIIVEGYKPVYELFND